MSKNSLDNIQIGDFVTAYGTGYWQLIDIKPKIAYDDYNSESVKWKKGDILGKWVILKKAFTDKMKPRIYFSYEDSSWLKPVSNDILKEIEIYFSEHPEYKQKFDNAEVKLLPTITNIWIDLPEESESDFRDLLATLPEKYTMDDFLSVANKYKAYISKPSTKYLLNLFSYPWNLDEKANLLYSGWELTKE